MGAAWGEGAMVISLLKNTDSVPQWSDGGGGARTRSGKIVENGIGKGRAKDMLWLFHSPGDPSKNANM